MALPIFRDLVLILGLSVVAVLVLRRMRLPGVIGFLITGVLCGPHGLALVQTGHEVDALAEIGVVLLLFTVGLEFSFRTLWEMRDLALLGGCAQVMATGAAGFAAGRVLGLPIAAALLAGMLVSLSSTAIAFKLLQDRAEQDSPHGRASMAILIFQDLAVAPMMIFLPWLADPGAGTGKGVALLVLKAMAVVAGTLVAARWGAPFLFHQVARARSRELFLVTAVFICFGVAWGTAMAGLSIGLGAFLAGVIVSESEFSPQVLGHVLPFRDTFMGFFFISIGMLVDLRYVADHVGLVAGGVLVLMAAKTVLASLAVGLAGYPLRTGLLAGLALSQVGELSFVLAERGAALGLIGPSHFQLFLAMTAVTMAAAPFVAQAAPWLTSVALRLPLPPRLLLGFKRLARDRPDPASAILRDHLVIVGFGLNGHNLVLAARNAGIPHVVIEMNPETVRRERAAGLPIFFGDATQEAVLRHAQTAHARVMVIAITDPSATRQIVQAAKQLNPALHLIVRTRYVKEVEALYRAGADEVVPEEFETSVEIFTHVLEKYLVSQVDIEAFITEIRAGGYRMLRSPRGSHAHTQPPILPGVEINLFPVAQGSEAMSTDLASLRLRNRFQVTILAIGRGPEVFANPPAETVLQAHDVVYLLGTPGSLARAAPVFQHPPESVLGYPERRSLPRQEGDA